MLKFLKIFILCSLSILSMSLLHQGAQNWVQYSRCGLTSTGRLTSLDLLAVFFLIQPYHYQSLSLSLTINLIINLCGKAMLMAHISLGDHHDSPSYFLRGCFPPEWLPVRTGAWSCFSPCSGLCTILFWTSSGFLFILYIRYLHFFIYLFFWEVHESRLIMAITSNMWIFTIILWPKE